MEQCHFHDVGGFMVRVSQPRRPKHGSLLAFDTAGLVSQDISIAGSMKMYQICCSISTAFGRLTSDECSKRPETDLRLPALLNVS